MQIYDLVKLALEKRASDIHISAGERPALRVDGEIIRLNGPVLNADDAKRAAYSIMKEKYRTQFEHHLETDFAVSFKGMSRFRVNVFTQSRGIGMVLRQIPSKIPTMEQLGLPAIFERIAGYHKGLVLVTGPTGSGKSTTLAAIIDHINRTTAGHILTVEDPVEFVHTPNRCIINHREIGSDTRSFSAAIRSALREDPDVILVGELRDLETVALAISAAETGHLVFGTMHTNSAPETVDRVIDQFPHEQQAQIRTMLSTSLMAVISQLLVPRFGEPGRAAVQEIMICNAAVRNLIRENKLFQIPSIMQASRTDGMQTMEMAAKDMAMRRKITRDVAISITNNPRLFDDVSPMGPRPTRPQ
ncbi:MAG TPA: type IV pilus twitching motility protein PilT [Myxococcota bacterium]|nr:type IV pilus twitching motility protein PilT [Myxococcota bacterium]